MHMSETRVVQRSPANSTPAKLSFVQTWVKINVCTTFLKTTKIIQNHWSPAFFLLTHTYIPFDFPGVVKNQQFPS